MPTIDRWILVDARVEEVFRFVADYRNTPRYERQFSKFEAVGEPTYGLGLTVNAVGRFKGMPVHATLRVTEFVENERIVSRSVKGLKSCAEWHFANHDGRTRVRLVASYDWPVPILSGTLRRILQAELAAITEAGLRELKGLVEGPRPSESQRSVAPTDAG